MLTQQGNVVCRSLMPARRDGSGIGSSTNHTAVISIPAPSACAPIPWVSFLSVLVSVTPFQSAEVRFPHFGMVSPMGKKLSQLRILEGVLQEPRFDAIPNSFVPCEKSTVNPLDQIRNDRFALWVHEPRSKNCKELARRFKCARRMGIEVGTCAGIGDAAEKKTEDKRGRGPELQFRLNLYPALRQAVIGICLSFSIGT